MGKTLLKSQNVSLNGFFWGKHHLALAVLTKDMNTKERNTIIREAIEEVDF